MFYGTDDYGTVTNISYDNSSRYSDRDPVVLGLTYTVLRTAPLRWLAYARSAFCVICSHFLRKRLQYGGGGGEFA